MQEFIIIPIFLMRKVRFREGMGLKLTAIDFIYFSTFSDYTKVISPL